MFVSIKGTSWNLDELRLKEAGILIEGERGLSVVDVLIDFDDEK